MKKILIFLILFLSGAWAYTSWYWYSCYIKDLCWVSYNSSELSESPAVIPLSLSGSLWEDEDVIWSIDEDEIILSQEDIVSLSVNDVTWPSSTPPPQAVIEQEVGEEQQENSDSLPWSPSQNISELPSPIRDICQNPLEWPIRISGNNNAEEVLALEKFLRGRGLLLSSDGVFWSDDFEAVKAFQEEFRSEILTPWGINNPTWYVGRTTIQKVQELSCE